MSVDAARDKTGYAGSAACGACHADLAAAFDRTPHHAVENISKFDWKQQACESCHGPGEKHAGSADVDAIVNPAKLSTRKSDAICLGCHRNEETHAGRIAGGHARSQVGCVACHSVHSGQHALVPRTNAAINAQCAECHGDVLASFNQPYSHQLVKNAMSCIDCHNPHGTTQVANAKVARSNEPGCFSCHGDKRGPFAFPHAPVELEGCGSCHEPHGSANPRMLNRHEVRLTCLECHSVATQTVSAGGIHVTGVIPPAFHDIRTAQYRNCTNCHIKVHGSNADTTFMR